MSVLSKWNKISLVKRIVGGLLVGIILGIAFPAANVIGILGDLFIGALKGVAPILVFFLVMSSLSRHEKGNNMGRIICLYVLGTFLSAIVAVVGFYIFPVLITFPGTVVAVSDSVPAGVGQVFMMLLMNIVENPVTSLTTANYIGILAWAVVFGIALRGASDTTKTMLQNISDCISQAVSWVISFAPLGVLGLVFKTVSENGLTVFSEYGRLLAVLVGCMAFVVFVVNPVIVFCTIGQNPYPLVFKCLKESFITAFFTRSSAANIPVNMRLCKSLGLNEDTYSVSIPLGATINMAGASIVITVMTLSAAYSLGYSLDIGTAIILSLIATISACGTSGVAGGSILLIPLACSLFGISNDIAMQVVGVGFIIGVIQDSCETGLNSSTDALFTIAAEFHEWKKAGKDIRHLV